MIIVENVYATFGIIACNHSKFFDIPAVTTKDISAGSAIVLLDDYLAECLSASALRHLALWFQD